MENYPHLHPEPISFEDAEKSDYCVGFMHRGLWKVGETVEEVYRFLILDEGALVIGPLSNHMALLEVRDGQAVSNFDSRVIGAGIVSRRGVIISWESGLFRKETPPALRATAEELIERLLADGTLSLPQK